MGILEATVVAYLRQLYYPDGFAFPLVSMDPHILRLEVIREAMTLVMIAAVAWIAGTAAWSRLMSFLAVFGLWDLSYYAGLKLLLGWPKDILEPDILFLIPGIWIGPVLAPALVAAAWAAGGLLLHRASLRSIGMGPWLWIAAAASSVLILGSFLIHAGPPEDPGFHWILFGLGYATGVGALGLAVLRARALPGRRPR